MEKICGIISVNKNNDFRMSNDIKKMMRMVSPKDSNIMIKYTGSNAWLGTKIIKSQNSDLRYYNLNKKYNRFHIVFNGAIYSNSHIRKALPDKNHKLFPETDEEIILYLYKKKGTKCLQYLDGIFVFAIWDELKKELFIAKDRLGVKPLYYSYIESKKLFLFASELKCFLGLDYFPKKIDYKAVDEYLSFEYIPYKRTIFKKAKKVLPGHYIIFKNKIVFEKKYWDINFDDFKKDDFPTKKKEFFHLLDSSVKKRLDCNESIGLFSSGGIDSSSIGFLMQKHIKENLNTFSVNFREKSFDESKFSRLFAKAFNIKHTEKYFDLKNFNRLFKKIIGTLDGPFADASVFPTVFLSEFSKKKVNIALSGEGSDEILLGYPTYFAHKIANIYSKFPKLLNRSVLNQLTKKIPVSFKNFSFDFKIKKFISGLDTPAFKRHIIWLGAFNTYEKQKLYTKRFIREINEFSEFDAVYKILENCPSKNFFDKIQYLDIKTYLEGDILLKSYIASTINSQTIRMPFLDYNLVNFACSLPVEMKLKGTVGKYILRKSMQQYLPHEIISRPKKGFGIPLSFWINSGLKKDFDSLLKNSVIGDSGLFKMDYIKNLLKQHLILKKDNRKQLWCLYMLEKWCREWL